jgi:hypothetical protein
MTLEAMEIKNATTKKQLMKIGVVAFGYEVLLPQTHNL